MTGDDLIVRPHHKGFPPDVVGRRVGELRGQLTLEDGGFATPVLLLNEDALDHNLRVMQTFCNEAGASFAPHVKTTMSPEIVARQLKHGAWAVTVASCVQAMTVRQWGATRLLIANELVDGRAIEWLGRELDRDASFTAYCYVDSPAGVATLDEVLGARGQQRSLPVLIEFGPQGGRAGVRRVDDALRVAELVRQSECLELAGVAGFEGIVGTGFGVGRLDEVTEYVRHLRDASDAVFEVWDGASQEFVVTAGGSAFFELVRDGLAYDWRHTRPIRLVLRSGAYVTHDSLVMEEYRALVAHRYEAVALAPALELWATVLSRPEPNLAILDFGRRDVGADAGLPVPRLVRRRARQFIEGTTGAEVVALNDQHAYVRARTGVARQGFEFDVGDLVGFGISHPCTTLDKWRLIPMVDRDRRLVGAVRTYF